MTSPGKGRRGYLRLVTKGDMGGRGVPTNSDVTTKNKITICQNVSSFLIAHLLFPEIENPGYALVFKPIAG